MKAARMRSERGGIEETHTERRSLAPGQNTAPPSGKTRKHTYSITIKGKLFQMYIWLY